MKPELFAELLEAANDALEHAKGKRNLKTTVMGEVAPMTGADVRHVRETLHTSQAGFAQYLKVSPKLVQAWEANTRAPNGPALVLLRIMEKQPGVVDAVFASSTTSAMARTRLKAKHAKAGVFRAKNARKK